LSLAVHLNKPFAHTTQITSSIPLLSLIYQSLNILSVKMISAVSFASILALLGAASAAPTATSPVYPPTTTSANFRLVANVTANDLSPSINNFVVSSYHTAAGDAWAVLVDNTTTTSGRIFYINGTATEVRFSSANILSDEGTLLYPAGLSVNSPGTNGEQALSINAGAGETGISLTQFPDPISALQAPASAGFYACNNALPFGSAIQVLSKASGESTPAGCADITLLPQCSEGSGLAHPYGQITNCYADVAGIDWTVYSTD
jgi:hypothetical protein